MATHEVTVEQFLRFRKSQLYSRQQAPTLDCPVHLVSWFDAAAYCNWLSEQEGIPQQDWCFLPNAQGNYGPGMKLKSGYLNLSGYRLPTEAEWEFACRAGSVTSRFFGDTDELLDRYAWFAKNSLERWTLPIGSLRPNGLGMFDMLGNVSEWQSDEGSYYPSGRVVEDNLRLGNKSGESNRTIRGGGFADPVRFVRSANRAFRAPNSQHIAIGFRVARTIVVGPVEHPAAARKP